MRNLPLVLALLVSFNFLLCSIICAQDESFTFSASEIGTIEHRGTIIKIYASSRNESNTVPSERWQFRFEPLSKIKTDNNGNIIYNIDRINDDLYHVSIKMVFFNDHIKYLAYHSVMDACPDEASEIKRGNINLFTIRHLKIEIPDIEELLPGASLVRDEFNIDAIRTEIPIVFRTESKEVAEQTARNIDNINIDYEYSIKARRTMLRSTAVKWTMLGESSLKIALDGLGTNEVFVHRDDIRNLCQHIHNEIEWDEYIEIPEGQITSIALDSNDDIIDGILKKWNKSENFESFNNEQFSKTYNAQDLQPSVITSEIQNMFNYDEGENRYTYNVEFEVEGKGSLIGLLSAEARLKGSYSSDEYERFLSKHEINTETEGTRIIPRSIKLRRVNMSDFDEDRAFTRTRYYVGPSEEFRRRGTIYLSLEDDRVEIDTYGPGTVPVGGIIMWWGRKDRLPFGFEICDGQEPTTPDALFEGLKPDLRDRFVKGALDTDNLIENLNSGGRDTVQLSRDNLPLHTHGHQSYPNDAFGAAPGGEMVRLWHTSNPDATTDGGFANTPFDIKPPYQEVFYIIRVK